MARRHQSTIGIKYSIHRGKDPTARDWFKNRQEDDGAEDLWRIPDGVYDLTNFINLHPGGRDWLLLTKGTDITEAFESHHISISVENQLQKFYIRQAVTPRNYPFTFEEDGFYKTLKRIVKEALKTVPKQSKITTNRIIDGCLFLTFVFSALSLRFWSIPLSLLSAYFLASTSVAAHNYFHQRDNFRMYYFNISGLSFRDWRVSHVLSHHLYTNTTHDLEITLFEPLIQYLPKAKSFIVRYGSWVYFLPLCSILVFKSVFIRYRKYISNKEKVPKAEILPFILPFVMYIFGGQGFLATLCMWIFILFIASTIGAMLGFTSAHHHPLIFHDGDSPRPQEFMDWGLFQMTTVMDRYEVAGNHYLGLTTFGDHGLHHLFPTLDHGVLPYLYPVFEETMKKFNVHLKMISQIQMWQGHFAQLSRTTPNTNPPYFEPISK